MTTTHIGTVHTIFGIDSIEATINAMVGDFAADFDMEAAANGYRDYLTDYLPATLVVVGNDVMCHIDDVQALNGDGPIEEIHDAIRDDMATGDGFDISRYAKPACAKCGAAGRNADSHTCGTKQPESAEQNTPATLGDERRHVMRIRVTLSLEVDPERWQLIYPEMWQLIYGNGYPGAAEVRGDVRDYVLNAVQQCPAAQEDAITRVTLVK